MPRERSTPVRSELVRCLWKHKGLRGALIFSAILFAGFSLLSRDDARTFLETVFTPGIASMAVWLMKAAGMKVSALGSSISSYGFAVDIKYGCNAVYEVLVFTAAIAAYPQPMKDRCIGILFGMAAIYTLNVFRVAALFLTGVFSPFIFKILHEHVAQALFILLMVILWVLWVSKPNAGVGTR